MKKILSYIIMGILGVTVFTACSDDESSREHQEGV